MDCVVIDFCSSDGPKDKVLQAIESNPTLKRLLQSMNENGSEDKDNDADNDADSDDGFDNEDSEDDKELFVHTRPEHESSVQDSSIQADILDNMNAYVDDNLSIQEIMARFQSKQDLDEKLKLQHQAAPKQPSPAKETGPDIESMSGPELVNYWIKQSPDAFIYEHSLNDEYKHIIRDAVYTQSVEDMESKLSAINRKTGKLALHDDLRQESFGFYQTILEETMKWKRLQIQLLEQFENQDKPELPVDQQPDKITWVDSDDDFEALDYSLLEEPTVPSATPPSQSDTHHPVNDSKGKENAHRETTTTSSTSISLPNTDLNINIPLLQSSLLRPTNEVFMERQSVPSSEQLSINDADAMPEPVEADASDVMELEESEDEQWQHVDVDHEYDAQVSGNNIVPNLSPSSKGSPSKGSPAEIELFVEENGHQMAPSPEMEQDHPMNHDIVSVHEDDDSQVQNTIQNGESLGNGDNDSVHSSAKVNGFESESDPAKRDDFAEDDMEGIEGDHIDHQNNSQVEDPAAQEAKDQSQTIPQPVNDITNAEMEEEIEAYMADQAQVVDEHDGYNSEEELGSKLEAEDSEYARFVAEFGSRDYTDVREEINDELRALGKEQRRQKRDMDELTTQMIEDAQVCA